jgi:mannose-6-phosphate isomerase-like protein (cupin superfamily)
MNREVKIWGERWLIRQDSTHAISYLKVKEGHRCSWHVHQEKYNLFVVLEGEFKIIIAEEGTKVEIILKAGETLTIKPNQWHEFQGVTSCQVIEEMYIEYREDDITRKNQGGKVV